MMESTARSPEAGMDTDHIVNLNDGVFAITLLDIRVPDIPQHMVATGLPTALLSLWPSTSDTS